MGKKTWLITGCSSGFGRALAEVLLERGEQVVATARDPRRLDERVASYGERALKLALDVTKPESIAAAIAAVDARFGPIDVLVNNAGYGAVGLVEETPVEVYRTIMETNVFGALAMIQAVLPAMRARRAGQIVNIGSVAGLIGFPGLSHYCASKFALSGMTESLAKEVKPLGINVTLAELGPFATGFTTAMEMHFKGLPDYDMAALAQEAGNSHWDAGDDPRTGALALLAALDDPAPPVHLILGKPGLDVVALHDGRRGQERAHWHATSTLEAY